MKRKIASYDPRQGGWIVWDRKLLHVASYHGQSRLAAMEAATQMELDL